jgi:hypothetical protein
MSSCIPIPLTNGVRACGVRTYKKKGGPFEVFKKSQKMTVFDITEIHLYQHSLNLYKTLQQNKIFLLFCITNNTAFMNIK